MRKNREACQNGRRASKEGKSLWQKIYDKKGNFLNGNPVQNNFITRHIFVHGKSMYKRTVQEINLIVNTDRYVFLMQQQEIVNVLIKIMI